MNYTELIKKIQQKQFAPIYFLFGDEPYYIYQIFKALDQYVLDESQKAFNQVTLYGKETDLAQILEQAKRFPMGSDRQLVLVKQAQHIKKIEQLLNYAERPQNTTVLALAYQGKKIDGRSKDGKKLIEQLKKHGIYFESKKMYENQLPNFIGSSLKNNGFQFEQKVPFLLAEFLGNDLQKIENEIEKLKLTVDASTLLNEEIIESKIGISKEFNNFEFQKAVATKNVLKSNRIVQYFCSNPNKHPLVVSISTLFSFFSKLAIYQMLTNKQKDNACRLMKINPYFFSDYTMAANHYPVKKTVQIIGLLKAYDLKSKGVDHLEASSNELLKELTYQIFN